MKLVLVKDGGEVVASYEDKDYCDWEELFDEIKSDAKVFIEQGELQTPFVTEGDGECHAK